MSIKSKVFAAAATLTLVGGVGAMAALSAGAATPSCGDNCIDVFSREFGTHTHPNFVIDTLRQGAQLGQPVILFRTSNSDPAEDFTVSFQGSTSDFFAAGLVSSTVALHYGCTVGPFVTCANGVDDPAFEEEYAPFGVDSGLCVGVARTAYQNEGVTLQPCGVTSKTVWILDVNDSPAPVPTVSPSVSPPAGPTLAFSSAPPVNDSLGPISDGYMPLINGSDTNFSHPFVLTYPKNGFPTDRPRPQVRVQNLTGFSTGFGDPIGAVQDNQLWGADFGVLR